MSRRENIENWFKRLQNEICLGLEKIDGHSSFQEDVWDRPEGGGGISRIIENGNIIEKGGVNFSAVHGSTPEKIGKALGFGTSQFYATGVSIVLHPVSPWVPIIHMNIRYFEMNAKDQRSPVYWFGGGIDLTPHYVNPQDGGYLHHQLKKVCDRTDAEFYSKFKKWADDYFYIKHRKETRGVGGIFFDRINEESSPHTFEELWNFVQNVGTEFLPIYEYFTNKYGKLPYEKIHQEWQLLRRGRYVEFNLVWDKGTKFGLDTDGRTESILMSLPANASWKYNFVPENGSKEAETLSWLKKGINWIDHA